MLNRIKTVLLPLLAWLSIPGTAWAAGKPVVDTGDTTFIIICAALVMIMTPGLALFYGGMVRKKNVLSTIMLSFIVICVVSIIWALYGYTLAFGPDVGRVIGGLDYLGLQGVGQEPSGTIPHFIFMAFQLMFALITVAIITGSVAERMRFPAFLAFIVLWASLVYSPLCHWVWGGGWLMQLGALDFAGGTVVHISSGVAGLVAALVIGQRRGYGSEPMVPHNLPMTVLGAALLWFGWFGFNAGSALAANGLAASAFAVTHLAAAAGGVSWVLAEWAHHGKPTLLGCVSGAVAGLVAITPAAGFVAPLPAILIGLVVGPLCYFAVAVVKSKLGYDDALDAFGIHGVGGTWGAVATGLFASKTVNQAGADGLFYGHAAQLVTQLIGVGATVVFAGLATFLILKLIGLFTDLRVSADDEAIGLDVSVHGENAYAYADTFGGSLTRDIKAAPGVSSSAIKTV
ncbi:ammonium transporter [Desulforamulus hydrothermalis]|uniref:Ammonium transporter n=1 Tax=Desulforamulus hydrothermalis Lam5 = DSM 18033 TaxID=1121428 RepID=K8DYN5_9FIRM|nr:ammonium transporter [Desulforamulus hydrothermalis]CCO08042.1 Ammonium transporter NrgA [Desulforamulus hydrothermalis Lam5 = DSM 18033]SHG83413.1 ammonium transporter [Desulforamulus hydrothermalis Lam5 = DSM 18033]